MPPDCLLLPDDLPFFSVLQLVFLLPLPPLPALLLLLSLFNLQLEEGKQDQPALTFQRHLRLRWRVNAPLGFCLLASAPLPS